MKVKKISRKWIKPHTPTPQNLKYYKISFLDKPVLPINCGVVLFYQSKPKDYDNQLEESLAKILVQFYLLAGRFIKNDQLVDCSDEGAEFVRAEALDMELLALVTKTDEAEQLHPLFPDQYFRSDESADAPLLSIQATHFPCGGVAIAVSISHRVFDAWSVGTFVAAWSNATNDSRTDKINVGIIPSFDLPSLLPYKDHEFGVISKQPPSIADNGEIIVFKRFVFNKAALTALKSKVVGPNKSGVRVVCVVIAGALIGLDGAKHGRYRDFHIFQPVNMRGRTVPPQPKHACGNLSVISLTPRVRVRVAEEIQELVDLMGDAIQNSIRDHAEILSPNTNRDGYAIIQKSRGNLEKAFGNPETNMIIFSDWSKFGFYEADFGWGKPVWVGTGLQKFLHTNFCLLMGNKQGDGIEAWVQLYPNDMRYFQKDERIKLYTNNVSNRCLL